MRIRVEADGRDLQGTPVQIVEMMRSVAFGQYDRPLGEYVDWAAEQALRMVEVDMTIAGETDEEKCASFVSEMLRTGLAMKV